MFGNHRTSFLWRNYEKNITNKYFINDVIYVYDTYSCFK